MEYAVVATTRAAEGSEICTLWEEGREYSFTDHTDAPDYPYPLPELTGFWRVEPFERKSYLKSERASRISLPPDIPVINYVGIPLSGQVSGQARLGYFLLREEGPNDGLTQIANR